MNRLTTIGRLFIALAMMVFGIQHFIYLEFVTRIFPPLPLWIPGHAILACIFGAFLCVTSAAILFGTHGRMLTLLLGCTALILFAAFRLPALLADLSDAFLWVNSGKAMVLAGANFLVAGSLANPVAITAQKRSMNALERLIPLGRFFLAGFLILAGVIHFIYPQFVAVLIPDWIPAHMFFAYFTGTALITGGIGIIVPWTTRLAASLSGLMIFLWVVLLHIPRAYANFHDSNETTAAFEALAMCGAAILVAVSSHRKGAT